MNDLLSNGRNPRRGLVWVAALLGAAAVLAVHAYQYLPFFADDAFISLRYAKRLNAGEGLTWTAGHPVEGYSNLLWILLIAGVGRLGVDLVIATRALALLCTIATLGAIVHATRSAGRRFGAPAIIGLATVALAGPVAAWTVGGLEQPLVAALLAWATVLSFPIIEMRRMRPRQVVWPSLLLGLLCLTRPDGPLFVATTISALLVMRVARGRGVDLNGASGGGGSRSGLDAGPADSADGRGRTQFGSRIGTLRIIAALLFFPVILSLGQLCFRLVYYGEWLPNTALVKVSLTAHHFWRGADYLWRGFLSLCPVSAIAAGVALVGLCVRERRGRFVLLLSHGLGWAGYVAIVGGDIFASWRHWIPLIVVMALSLAEGASLFGGRLPQGRWRMIFIAGSVAVFAVYFHVQWGNPQNQRARQERWQWDGRPVGLMLKKGFAAELPVHAVTAAGSLPYWSELPSIDMMGLNDYYLPRHPPKTFGRGFLGHELGDGRYILDCRPDLVIFRRPTGRTRGTSIGGRQLSDAPEFQSSYTLVRFLARDPVEREALIWVRRNSEKIGIRASADSIIVPGFLLNGHPETTAYLDDADRFVVSASRDRPAIIRDLPLPPGRWRIRAEAASKVCVTVHPAAEADALVHEASSAFRVPGRQPVAVHVMVAPLADTEVEVRLLVLSRSPAP